jgi:hypothetical protein
MARGYVVNAESMIYVKGRSDSAIAALSELGLCTDSIQIQVTSNRKNIRVDAYGDSPPEQQFFGAGANVSFTLVHFDKDVLDECLRLSWGGAPAVGAMGHAGQLMGNNLGRFAPGGFAGNNYVGLNIVSAVGERPWRFLFSCLSDNPYTYPVGTLRSEVQNNWQAFPYSADPWNSGQGSFGAYVFDHTADV